VQAIEGLRGAATVTRAGQVRLEAASGPADAGAGVICTPRTRFQICSVSKQFAAAAAMLLAESGQLDLAEPVARWLPGGPPQWQRVTLHHLLTHTAGVRHWGDVPGFDASQPMDLAERVALIQQAPLLTDPGTAGASTGSATTGMASWSRTSTPRRTAPSSPRASCCLPCSPSKGGTS
jgi:CubicO group peptidase (beta-lactamase class C family)